MEFCVEQIKPRNMYNDRALGLLQSSRQGRQDTQTDRQVPDVGGPPAHCLPTGLSSTTFTSVTAYVFQRYSSLAVTNKQNNNNNNRTVTYT